MKIKAHNREYTVNVWHDPRRLDGYTILIGNDLWGCTPDVDTLAGYAGDITKNGYENPTAYVKWAAETQRRVGRKITDEEIPDVVLDWIYELIQNEEQ